MGSINFSATNYLPDPLLYSCPRLAVMVSSHIIGACCVLPMAFFLAPTHTTVMDDVHTVSVGPAVSSNVMDTFNFHPLGVCLTLSVYRYPGPPIVYCVCLLELLGQGRNGCGEVGYHLALRHHCLSVIISIFQVSK